MTAIEDRFWAKVAIAGPKECWEWTACREVGGYGRFWHSGGSIPAHRVAYELSTGESPGDLLVDHICRNRVCVNPAHLRLATAKQNAQNQSLARNNTSGFTGVYFNKCSRKWRAHLFHNGRRINLGYFKTVEAAYEARIVKERELFTHSYVGAESNHIDVSHIIRARARQLELF
jgi:hypothetical protein